jgi:hypothetical protein
MITNDGNVSLIMVMYTGGKLPDFPGHETQLPKRDEPVITDPARSHLSTKAHYLTDDHLKVTNSLLNSSLGSQVNHQGS